MIEQGRMAGPLALNLISNYSLNIGGCRWARAATAATALVLCCCILPHEHTPRMLAVCLSFVGKLGDTQQLAAAALGTTLSAMSGKIPLVRTLACRARGI